MESPRANRPHDQLEAGLANGPADEKALLYLHTDRDPQYTQKSHPGRRRSNILWASVLLAAIFLTSLAAVVLTAPCSSHWNKSPSLGHSASSDRILIGKLEKPKIEKSANLGKLKGRQAGDPDPSPISTPGDGSNPPTTTFPPNPSVTDPTSAIITATGETTATSEVPEPTTTDPSTSEDPTTSSPPPPVTTTAEDVPTATSTVPSPTTTGTSTSEDPSSTSPSSPPPPTTQESTSTLSSSSSSRSLPDTAPASSTETAVPTSIPQTSAPETTSSSVEPSSTEESSTAEPTSTEPVSSSAIEEVITTTLPGGAKKTITSTSYVEVEPTAKPEENATDDPGLQDAGSSLSRNSFLSIALALMAGGILVV